MNMSHGDNNRQIMYQRINIMQVCFLCKTQAKEKEINKLKIQRIG